jgi:hypothetical protein
VALPRRGQTVGDHRGAGADVEHSAGGALPHRCKSWTARLSYNPPWPNIFLVSVVELPLDDDSVPLHVLADESMEQQIAVGEFLIESAERFNAYGNAFACFHEAAWEEVRKMAKKRGLEFSLRPIVKELEMRKVIEQLGEKELVEELGIDRRRS